MSDSTGFQRKSLVVFADDMEGRLREKDEERGAIGWLESGCSAYGLLEVLKEKVEAAENAMTDCHENKVDKACVDIANFAMMISDRLRRHKKC